MKKPTPIPKSEFWLSELLKIKKKLWGTGINLTLREEKKENTKILTLNFKRSWRNKKNLPEFKASFELFNDVGRFVNPIDEEDYLYIDSVYGFYEEEGKNILKNSISIIKDIATSDGIKIFISKDSYSEKHFKSIGFSSALDFPGEEYPISFIGSFRDHLHGSVENSHEKAFFIELKSGYLQNKIQIVNTFKKAIETTKKEDITFTYDFHMGSSTSVCRFYFEGFKGFAYIYYSNPITMELKKGNNWSDSETVGEFKVHSINEIPFRWNELLNKSVEEIAMPNLLKPPRMHFTDFCSRHQWTSGTKTIDELFELLSTELDPKEIEKLSLTEKERPVADVYDCYPNNRVYIIKIFNRYFVFSNENYSLFHNKEEAIEEFNDRCNKIEKEQHLERLNKIRKKKNEIIQTL